MSDLVSDFNRLREKVLVTTPVLKEVREKKGNETLHSFALGYQQFKRSTPVRGRQVEFVGEVAIQTQKLLGPAVASSVASQLEKNYFVSTADHHGPICHPFFLNANLITAASAPDMGLENIIVLSCANVSLNNSSFPRGLIFHSDIGDPTKLHHVPLFPAKDSPHAVCGQRPFTQRDLIHAQKIVWDTVARGEVRREIAEKIISIIDAIYNQPVMLASQTYSEQITKTNFQLWQRFFTSLTPAPNLVYLDQETIVRELLVKYHLNRRTIVSDLLFDISYQPLVVKYFDGIIGAFSTKQQTGTYLFWALPKGKKYRERLWPHDGELVNSDGAFRIALTAEAISEKIHSRELIPSTLLVFLVTSFYYGVTALGGFSQPSYLTAMKQAYLNLLNEVGNSVEAEISSSVETKVMGSDMALTLLQDKWGNLHQATGLDLILYGKANLADVMMRTAKIMTFAEATDIMMPLFYEVMYPENQREEQLRQITDSQIARLIGLDKKIQPCVFM